MENEWESSKAAFMESLGHRAHRWGVNAVPGASSALSVYEPAKQATAGATKAIGGQKPLQSGVLQDHADAVAAVNRASASGKPIDACRVLQSAATGLDNSSDALGYRLLLTTLEHMVGEGKSVPGSSAIGVEAGYFSPLCFDKEHIPVNVRNERKSRLSSGLRHFLEGQQLEIWDAEIQRAIRDVDIRFDERQAGTTMLHKLRRFVNYLYRKETIPNYADLVTFSGGAGSEGNNKSLFTPSTIGGRGGAQVRGAATTSPDVVPFWALIYHYLRVGKLDLAVEEVNETRPVLPGEGEVAIILKAMLEDMKLSSTATGTTRTPAKPSSTSTSSQTERVSGAMKRLEALYKEDMMKDVNSVDPYRTAVFNLVGLIDKRHIVMCAIPNFNFDDFLWANMWFIEMSRLISIRAPQFHSPFASRTHTHGGITDGTGKRGSTGEGSAATVDGEHELLELILALGGANYFDEHRNSPFKYALLLFACHRFGDAIVYLWQADKVFFAVHLTVLCLHYGLILPHMALHQNPMHPLVSSYYQTNVHDSSAFGNFSTSSSSSGANTDTVSVHTHHHVFSLTPHTVLSHFLGNEYLQQSAVTCLAYLMSLNSNWLKHAQLSYHSSFDKEYRDSHRMKSHEVVSSALESFLMTLSLGELNQVVGELDNSEVVRVKLNTLRTATASGTGVTGGTPAISVHSRGSIEDYLPDSRDVDTHLTNIARKFLQQHHDAESAKHFFTLAGKWKEVVEVLSDELMTNLKIAFSSTLATLSSSPGLGGSVATMNLLAGNSASSSTVSSRDQSAFWMQQADNFIRDYIQVPHSAVADLIARDGHQESLDFLIVLMQMYYFFVAFRQENDPFKALTIMDGLELIPSMEEHLRAIRPIHARLRGIMDDLLMVLMEVLRVGYQMSKAKMPPTASGTAANTFLAEREATLNGIRSRSRVLAKYVQMVKSQLFKADTTVQYICRLDALLI